MRMGLDMPKLTENKLVIAKIYLGMKLIHFFQSIHMGLVWHI